MATLVLLGRLLGGTGAEGLTYCAATSTRESFASLRQRRRLYALGPIPRPSVRSDSSEATVEQWTHGPRNGSRDARALQGKSSDLAKSIFFFAMRRTSST